MTEYIYSLGVDEGNRADEMKAILFTTAPKRGHNNAIYIRTVPWQDWLG